MFGKETYTSVVVRAADADGGRAAEGRTSPTNYKKAAVQAQVETEYFATLGDTNKQFLFAVVFVTVVMSIGGVFGVMNTMFAAISQRTKDIGVLRLMGYARWQILVAFLLESLLIALVGGILGCAARLAGRRLVGHQRGQQRAGRRQVRRAQTGRQRRHPGDRHAPDPGHGRPRRRPARALRRPAPAAGGPAVVARLSRVGLGTGGIFAFERSKLRATQCENAAPSP